MSAPENHEGEEPMDFETLLPWHAAGTLSPGEAQALEAAMTRDPELRRRYELACEEMSATIHLNETLGAPSVKAMDALFAKIDVSQPAATPPPSTWARGSPAGSPASRPRPSPSRRRRAWR